MRLPALVPSEVRKAQLTHCMKAWIARLPSVLRPFLALGVFVLTSLLAHAGLGWTQLPNDAEIEEAKTRLIKELTVKNPTRAEVIARIKNLSFIDQQMELSNLEHRDILGPFIIESSAADFRVVKMHRPKEKNPAASCEALAAFTVHLRVEAPGGGLADSTEYRLYILRFDLAAQRQGGSGWRFSSDGYEFGGPRQTDRGSQAQRDAVLKSYFDKAGFIPGFPGEDSEAGVRVHVTHSFSGTVEGAMVRVRDERTGEIFEAKTGADGTAQAFRKAAATDFPLRFTLLGLTLPPTARYRFTLDPPVDAGLVATPPFFVAINRPIAIPLAKRLTTTTEYELPLFRLRVSAMRWDAPRRDWVPTSAHLLISAVNRRKLLQAAPAVFTRTGVPGIAYVFAPPREALGTPRLSVFGMIDAVGTTGKWNDLRYADVPTAAAGAEPTVTLLLCPLEVKLERIASSLQSFLEPLIGDAAASRVTRPQFVMDPTAVVPNYLDGVIRLPPSLDLSSDASCETLMHEWTHHIMARLAADAAIEGQLGGAHEPWGAAATRELAYDEARANFFSVILSSALDLPRTPTSYDANESQNTRQNTPEAGDRVEGVGTSALLAYYAAISQQAPADATREFLGTQSYCNAQTGHPPRTLREFFTLERGRVEAAAAAGTMPQAEAARRVQALMQVGAEYRVNP